MCEKQQAVDFLIILYNGRYRGWLSCIWEWQKAPCVLHGLFHIGVVEGDWAGSSSGLFILTLPSQYQLVLYKPGWKVTPSQFHLPVRIRQLSNYNATCLQMIPSSWHPYRKPRRLYFRVSLYMLRNPNSFWSVWLLKAVSLRFSWFYGLEEEVQN